MATQINFEEELRKLINTFSLEPESDTPDFILVEYISGCLDTFNKAVRSRDEWYRFKPFDNLPETAHTIKLSSARKQTKRYY
jgi:hypothetical protein